MNVAVLNEQHHCLEHDVRLLLQLLFEHQGLIVCLPLDGVEDTTLRVEIARVELESHVYLFVGNDVLHDSEKIGAYVKPANEKALLVFHILLCLHLMLVEFVFNLLVNREVHVAEADAILSAFLKKQAYGIVFLEHKELLLNHFAAEIFEHFLALLLVQLLIITHQVVELILKLLCFKDFRAGDDRDGLVERDLDFAL